MKKIAILLLVVLVGLGAFAFSAKADPARTIPMKTGAALSADTLITGNGGTLYKVMATATAAAGIYAILDYATYAETEGSASRTNILTEGGEATQYDSVAPVDFGDEGIRFRNGMVILTTGMDVVVHYR